ncbi:hypothetical protein TGVEG_227820 [Toxoplasma gondii VEG]|uniref:Uncharacterized protein n=1 Tax=Toxoplasma gondii (strain ATCC 50861 / VEG) TaxID=432359 RepID=B9Q8B0_TOXGV|nr:hypothetical protein TGVEG_227820 [Toxoplasma gondii VEG]CEL76391.1 TPA: hypothetical protein BN1205_068610 [Toxoplasma gondii VEG]
MRDAQLWETRMALPDTASASSAVPHQDVEAAPASSSSSLSSSSSSSSSSSLSSSSSPCDVSSSTLHLLMKRDTMEEEELFLRLSGLGQDERGKDALMSGDETLAYPCTIQALSLAESLLSSSCPSSSASTCPSSSASTCLSSSASTCPSSSASSCPSSSAYSFSSPSSSSASSSFPSSSCPLPSLNEDSGRGAGEGPRGEDEKKLENVMSGRDRGPLREQRCSPQVTDAAVDGDASPSPRRGGIAFRGACEALCHPEKAKENASSPPSSSLRSSSHPPSSSSVLDLLPEVYIQQLDRQLGERRDGGSLSASLQSGEETGSLLRSRSSASSSPSSSPSQREAASSSSRSRLASPFLPAPSSPSLGGCPLGTRARGGSPPRPAGGETAEGRADDQKEEGSAVYRQPDQRQQETTDSEARDAEQDGCLFSLTEVAIKRMETEAMKAALDGRREDEAELREQLQRQRERGQARRRKMGDRQHDEGVQWELENVLSHGFQLDQVVARIDELEALRKQVEAETKLCVKSRQDELVSSSKALRDLEADFRELHDQAAATRHLLVVYRQRLLVPSLRVVLQQRKQQEQQERLRLLLQIQKVAALDMALEECQAEHLLPLSASLLVEALSLPLVAHGGRVQLQTGPGANTGGDRECEAGLQDKEDAGVILCVQKAKEKLLKSLESLRASIDKAVEQASRSLPPPVTSLSSNPLSVSSSLSFSNASLAQAASPSPVTGSPFSLSASACPWKQYTAALAAASLLPPSVSVGELLVAHLVKSAEKTGQQILLAFLPASLFSSRARGSQGEKSGLHAGGRERKEHLLILRERVDVPPGETRRHAAAVQAGEETLPSLGRLAKQVKTPDALSCLIKIFEAHMDVLLGLSSLLAWHSELISLHLKELLAKQPSQPLHSASVFVSSPSSLFASTSNAPETRLCGDSGPEAVKACKATAEGEAREVRTTLEVAADAAARARAEGGPTAFSASLHFVSLLFHMYHSLHARRRAIWLSLQNQVVDVLTHLTLADTHSCPAVNDIISGIHGAYAYVISGCRLCCVRDASQDSFVEKMEQEALDLLARVAHTDGRVSSHLRSWIEKAETDAESRAEAGSLLPARSPVVDELYRQVLRLLDALEREQLRSLLHLLEEENWQRLPVPRTFSFFAFGRQVPPAVPLEVYSYPNPAVFQRFPPERSSDPHFATSATLQNASVALSTSETEAYMPPFFRQPFPPRLPPFPYACDSAETSSKSHAQTAHPRPSQELLPQRNCFRGWSPGRPLPGVPPCLYTDEVTAPASDDGTIHVRRLQSPVVSLSAKLAAKELRHFFRLAFAFPLATFPALCAVIDQVGFYVAVAAGVSLTSSSFASLLEAPVSTSLAAVSGDGNAVDSQTRRKLLETTDAALLQSRAPALRALLLTQEARLHLLFAKEAGGDLKKASEGRASEAASPEMALRRKASSLSQGDGSGLLGRSGSGFAGGDSDEETRSSLSGVSLNLAHILRPMAKQSSPGALWGAAERATAVESAADMVADLHEHLQHALASSPPGWLAQRLTREQQMHALGQMQKLQRAVDELRSVALLGLAGCLCDSSAFICSLLRAVASDFPQTAENEASPPLGPETHPSSAGGPLSRSGSQAAGGGALPSVERALGSQRGLLRDLTRRLRCAGGGEITLMSQRDLWLAIEARSVLDCVEVLSAAPLPHARAVQGLSPGPLLSLADSLRGFLRDVHALVLKSSEAVAEASRTALAPRANGPGPNPSIGVFTGSSGAFLQEVDAGLAGGACEAGAGIEGSAQGSRCFFGRVDIAFLDGFTEAIAMSATDVLQWCRYQQRRTAEAALLLWGEAPAAGAGREETRLGARGATRGEQRGKEAVYSLRVLSNAVLRMEGFGFLPRGKAADLERRYLALLAENGQKKRAPQQSLAASPLGVEAPQHGGDTERGEGRVGRDARCVQLVSSGESAPLSGAGGPLNSGTPGRNQVAGREPRFSGALQQKATSAVERQRNGPSPEDLNRYLQQLDHHRRVRSQSQHQ